MEGLEVDDEVPGQDADLTAGDLDAVPGLERGADLLALAVVDETCHADEGHHVVAEAAVRQQELGQRGRAGGDRPRLGRLVRGCEILRAGRPAAAVAADTHRLSHLERAVCERASLLTDGLLHTHRVTTHQADRNRLGVRGDQGPGDAAQLPCVLLLDGRGRLPQGRERGEGECAVFLTLYWRNTASTCSSPTSTPVARRRSEMERALSRGDPITATSTAMTRASSRGGHAPGVPVPAAPRRRS